MKKKLRTILFLLILILLVGCSEEKDNSSPDEPNDSQDKVDDKSENNEEPDYPDIEPESKYEIRLRTDTSVEYRDVTLVLGESVDLPNKQGYTFHGYDDCKDGEGVVYIDENGQYIKEYHGTELLVLWPIYTANEYRITICEDGNPLAGISDLICCYNDNFCDDLPWDKIINRNRKMDDDESFVIVGFQAEERQLHYSNKEDEVTIEDYEECANHQEQTMMLNVITTDITDCLQCYEPKEITNDGLLKQTFETKDSKGFDYLTIPEEIDLDALREAGFEELKIKLTIGGISRGGIPRVVITSKEINKNKEFKQHTLIDTGKIEDDEFDSGQFVHNYTVSIEEITGDFYLYYNSENVGKKTWDCSAVTMELEFVK